MDNNKALPAFFQHGGGVTVLDELQDFDLEGDGEFENQDELLDAIIDGLPLNNDNEDEENLETFADGFGDLTLNKLPDYLQNQPFITPGRNLIPDTDDDIADILNNSTAERLKDQAATLAISKALGTPLNKSANKSTGPPPGLTPQSAARPLATPSEGFAGLNAPASLLGTPFSASKVNSNPPGLLPARDLTSSFPAANPPPPLTPQREVTGNVSVVSSILSPPPSVAGDVASPAPFFTPKPNFGRGKYMSVSDVRFVVNKVLQPLETQDPYADDFYFIQYTIKKNAREREKALQEQRESLPAPVKVPLPTWKDTKERITAQLLQSRVAFKMKVKEWEEKEQVLGHRIRSDVSRPREQLTLPSGMQDLEYFDVNDEDDLVEWKAPFTSRLWSTRLAVQRGYEALYTVQELQYLLTSPLILANPQAIEEIKHEIDNAVAVLSQALGIRTIENESFLGLNTGTSIQLDGRHIAAILQTTMGKKLLTRGLKLLSPQHRWTLIPIVLARILMTVPTNTSNTTTAAPTSSSGASSGGNSEALEVEKKLLKTMIEYLQFTYKQYSEIRQNRVEITISYANDLLNHLKQVLKNIMITQMEKNQLKESLLAEKTRAEIMHVIVSLGDHVSSSADPQVGEEWRQTKDAFMSLLDHGSN